jgi:hypothetical protein
LSLPVLDDFKCWLETNSRRVVKDSETWKAIHYTPNQWDTLVGYCEDGRLHISNALAENAIRPFAPFIGIKNKKRIINRMIVNCVRPIRISGTALPIKICVGVSGVTKKRSKCFLAI